MPRIALICATCGQTFSSYTSQPNRRFCSRECAGPYLSAMFRKRVERVCKNCGKVRSIPQSQIKYARYDFCNRECQHAYCNPQRACETCGKTFTYKRTHTTARYCSDKCREAGWRGSARKQVSKPCEWCGAIITDVESHINRRRFCSHGCRVTWVSEVAGRAGSRSEAAFAGALADAGLIFRRHKHFGRYSIDVFFPDARLAVEFDGDYWHDKPNMQERDAKRDAYMVERGLRVLRIRESAWKADPNAVIETIRAALTA